MTNCSIIFGGSGSIGLGIFNALKSQGENVITISRGKMTESEYHLQLSISDEALVEKLEFNINRLGFSGINCLIFAQRYRGLKALEDYELSILSPQIIINSLIKKFNDDSSIVFLTSNATKFITKTQPDFYHINKSALLGLVKFNALNLGPLGVRVNSISFGKINKYPSKNSQSFVNLKNIIPLKKIPTILDIADLVVFLSGKKSKLITGQNIAIDGGLSLVSIEDYDIKIY